MEKLVNGQVFQDDESDDMLMVIRADEEHWCLLVLHRDNLYAVRPYFRTITSTLKILKLGTESEVLSVVKQLKYLGVLVLLPDVAGSEGQKQMGATWRLV